MQLSTVVGREDLALLKKRRVWLGLLVTVGFLALFLYRTNFGEIGAAIGRANYVFVAPAIAVYFLGVWARARRWSAILHPLRRLSPGEVFPIIAIGYMANNLLPARIGELLRAYVLGERTGLSKSSILATILVERIFDGVALLLLMVFVSFLLPFGEFFQSAARLGAAIFVAGLTVAVAMAVWPGPALALTQKVCHRLPGRLGQQVGDIPVRFIHGLAVLRRPELVATVLTFSILAWLAEAAMYYLITLSFGIAQPYSVLVLMTAVANLGITLPSAPGGLGAFDALSKLTLTLFGVDQDLAAAYTIVLHAALWLPITLLGFIYLWQQGLDLRHLARSAAGARRDPSPGPSPTRGGE